MNNYKIIWSPKAYDDLQNIYTYIAYHLKEKHVANNLIKKILNSISNLNYSPERYIKLYKSNPKAKNLRKLQVNNYVVIYEVKHNTRASIYFAHISQQSKLFKSFITLKIYYFKFYYLIFQNCHVFISLFRTRQFVFF